MSDRLCALTGHQNFVARVNSFGMLAYECPCGVFRGDRRYWRWYERWVTVRWWPWRQWKRLKCAAARHDWVPEGLEDPTVLAPCYYCPETRG